MEKNSTDVEGPMASPARSAASRPPESLSSPSFLSPSIIRGANMLSALRDVTNVAERASSPSSDAALRRPRTRSRRAPGSHVDMLRPELDRHSKGEQAVYNAALRVHQKQEQAALAREEELEKNPVSYVACTLGDVLIARWVGMPPFGDVLSTENLVEGGGDGGPEPMAEAQTVVLRSSSATAATKKRSAEPRVAAKERPGPPGPPARRVPEGERMKKRAHRATGNPWGRPPKRPEAMEQPTAPPAKRRGRPPGRKNKIRFSSVRGAAASSPEPHLGPPFLTKRTSNLGFDASGDSGEEALSVPAPAAPAPTPPAALVAAEPLAAPAPLGTAPKAPDITSVYNHYLQAMPQDLADLAPAVLDTAVPFPPAGDGHLSPAEAAVMPVAARDAARVELLRQRLEWVQGELTAAGMSYGWGRGRANARGSPAFLRGVALKYARDRLRGRIQVAARKVKGGGEQGAAAKGATG